MGRSLLAVLSCLHVSKESVNNRIMSSTSFILSVFRYYCGRLFLPFYIYYPSIYSLLSLSSFFSSFSFFCVWYFSSSFEFPDFLMSLFFCSTEDIHVFFSSSFCFFLFLFLLFFLLFLFLFFFFLAVVVVFFLLLLLLLFLLFFCLFLLHFLFSLLLLLLLVLLVLLLLSAKEFEPIFPESEKHLHLP